MNPVRCMESRVHNVIGLNKSSPHALKQLRASIFCAREFMRDILNAGYIREALRLTKRIFNLCDGDIDGRLIHARTGIDPFDAVLCEPPLPEKFITVQYPKMQERLRRRRASRLAKPRGPAGPDGQR